MCVLSHKYRDDLEVIYSSQCLIHLCRDDSKSLKLVPLQSWCLRCGSGCRWRRFRRLPVRSDLQSGNCEVGKIREAVALINSERLGDAEASS